MTVAELKHNYREVRARLMGRPKPCEPRPVPRHERVIMRLPSQPVEIIPASEPRLPRLPAHVVEIIFQVAEKHGVNASQIISKQHRKRKLAWARHEAIWRVRAEVTLPNGSDAALPRIGKWFSGRDHTTILHSIAKWEAHRNRCAGMGVEP